MSIIDGGYRHFFVTELLQNAQKIIFFLKRY